MAHSNSAKKASKPAKPKKPYPEFPLFAHATRRWAKKIKGQLRYFGPWDSPDAALTLYLEERDEWFAGRNPRLAKRKDSLTIRDLLNRFLSMKEDAVRTGEITARTFRDYRPACERVARVLGLGRLVEDLAAEDFATLKREMGKTLQPLSMKTEMQRSRTIFRYAYESGFIDKPLRFGPAFKSPSRKVIARARRSDGPKMFQPAEIRLMLDSAPYALKAMVALGINCGFGNNDCATLTLDVIDLDTGWHTHARPKTQVERRCPLWPETAEAVRQAIDRRPTPKDPADDRLVFLTQYGRPWVRLHGNAWCDAVTQGMRRLLVSLDVKRPGVNFYALRHTFQTVADEVRDPVAVRFLMGHAPPESDMGDVYRERIDDSRLVAVVEHVRKWIFSDDESE